jgi:hypothetical protein
MKLFFSQLDSLVFEIASMSVTGAVIVALFYKNIKKFNTANPKPEVSSISSLMPYSATQANSVKAGLFVKDFPRFDIIGNDFIVDAIVWFEYNPQQISPEALEDFTFEKGTLIHKSALNTVLSEALSLTSCRIRLQFSTNLNHQFFPLGDHRIFLVLNNYNISAHTIVFATSPSCLSLAKLYIPGWRAIGHDAESGYYKTQLDPENQATATLYPRVIFSIDFARNGSRKVFIVMLPLFLAFFLGFLALTLNPLKHSRSMTTIAVASITGLLAYRFVIEKISPNVGYFTLTDHLYDIILTYTFIAFLINLALIEAYDINPWLIAVSKITAILTIEVSLIITFYYLLYKWRRPTL